MANFGYTMAGFGSGGAVPTAKVHTTTLTTSSDAGIWSVGGDWVYDTDETNSQSGTADNWLMMVAPYNTSLYATTPISYNTSTHTFTELASDWTMYNLGEHLTLVQGHSYLLIEVCGVCVLLLVVSLQECIIPTLLPILEVLITISMYTQKHKYTTVVCE
jgi:hypothetical protein